MTVTGITAPRDRARFGFSGVIAAMGDANHIEAENCGFIVWP
jgi:hypothetical protein